MRAAPAKSTTPSSMARMHFAALVSLCCLQLPGAAAAPAAPAVPAVSCVDDLGACVEMAGMGELRELHQWVLDSPLQSHKLLSEPPLATSLEVGAFSLLRELGHVALASVVEFIVFCRSSDPRCSEPLRHFGQLDSLRASLEQQVALLAQQYTTETGVRSAVLRAARKARSDLEKFGRDTSGAENLASVVEQAGDLVRWVGMRARMLAHLLGMHAWVRTLAVPGRGAPVFVLHDDYTSWPDMVRAMVLGMFRGGMPQLSLIEVGVQPEGDLHPLLHELPGLQYLGVYLADDNAGAEPPAAMLAARTRLAEFGDRASLYHSSSAAVASAFPRDAIDIVVLRLEGEAEDVIRNIKMWEKRIKPAGLLAGHGFRPEAPGVVKAVCSHRFGTDFHLGIGGGFWWFVEPEE